MSEVGLVLMDLSLNSFALDRGAAAILNYSHIPGSSPRPGEFIPKEILDGIRSRKPTELPTGKKVFRTPWNEYAYQAYLLESHGDTSQEPIVALHIEKLESPASTVDEVAQKFALTRRELEILRAMSTGIRTADIARRMNLSVSTIKSFLRLIMIKMGVRTRAGVMAKILENRTAA